MKIAVSSNGKDTDSSVSEVFGRCPYFILAEIENKKIEKIDVLENKSANQAGGAGIAAAQMIAENNVEAVITGDLGPRASSVLSQFKISAYKGSGKIKDAIEKFIEGGLEKIQ